MTDKTEPEGVNYDRLVAQEMLLFQAAERVAELINEAGISRTEVARRLGKSKGFITQLLTGKRNMTLRTLSDLGYVLGHSFGIVAKPGTASSLGVADVVPSVLAHRGRECPTPGRGRAGHGSGQLYQLGCRRLRAVGAPGQLPPNVYTKVSA